MTISRSHPRHLGMYGLGAAALLVATGACSSHGAVDTKSLAEEVRQAETAFAQTMADRDHAAFGSFLADEAIFFNGPREIRGKAAITDAWESFYQGPSAPFSWKPEKVQVLDSGTLGLSSGPVFDASGNRVSTFNSIWRRGRDGQWKIVFDNGCPGCECPPVAAGTAT